MLADDADEHAAYAHTLARASAHAQSHVRAHSLIPSIMPTVQEAAPSKLLDEGHQSRSSSPPRHGDHLQSTQPRLNMRRYNSVNADSTFASTAAAGKPRGMGGGARGKRHGSPPSNYLSDGRLSLGRAL